MHADRHPTVSDAFTASLSTRRLDLRSALGSYVVGDAVPLHRFQRWDGESACRVCGQHRVAMARDQITVMSFARFT